MIGRRQGDLDAGAEFLDAHGDLEERPAERFERRGTPQRAAGSGPAQLMQQPIGAGVQEQPELIGSPSVARGAVGFGVELVLLDHVFHPASGAIDPLVDSLGAAAQVGDDEADIGPPRGGLDPGDNLALARPAFDLVAGLEEATHLVLA